MWKTPDQTAPAVTNGNSWLTTNIFPCLTQNKELKFKEFKDPLDPIVQSKYKTIKIRLNPTPDQQQLLKNYCDMFAWYYNACVDILFHDKNNLSTIRSKNKKGELKNEVSYFDALKIFQRYKSVKRYIDRDELKVLIAQRKEERETVNTNSHQSLLESLDSIVTNIKDQEHEELVENIKPLVDLQEIQNNKIQKRRKLTSKEREQLKEEKLQRKAQEKLERMQKQQEKKIAKNKKLQEKREQRKKNKLYVNARLEFAFRQQTDKMNFPLPDHMDSHYHTRLPRGACKMFIDGLNSNMALHHGDLDAFNFKYKTKKNNAKNLIYFEDAGYPKWINNIQGWYSCKTKKKRHKRISFETIRQQLGVKSLTIKHDTLENKWWLYYPVDVNISEKQGSLLYTKPIKAAVPEKEVISIDPGVRTFATCYSSDGEIREFHLNNKYIEKTIVKLEELTKNRTKNYEEYSKTNRKQVLKINAKLRNTLDTCHWQFISKLKKYSQKVLYGKMFAKSIMMESRDPRMKRFMSAVSYCKLRERMKYKLGSRVHIVSERMTTKTCHVCKQVKNQGADKVYSCQSCGLVIDRDWNAAINIMRINTVVRSEPVELQTTLNKEL